MTHPLIQTHHTTPHHTKFSSPSDICLPAPVAPLLSWRSRRAQGVVAEVPAAPPPRSQHRWERVARAAARICRRRGASAEASVWENLCQRQPGSCGKGLYLEEEQSREFVGVAFVVLEIKSFAPLSSGTDYSLFPHCIARHFSSRSSSTARTQSLSPSLAPTMSCMPF